MKNKTADLNNVLHRLIMTPLFSNDTENMNGFVVRDYIAVFLLVIAILMNGILE